MSNNILSRLMFQYSFLLKNISCFIYIIVYETSSEKIEKLLESSLNLISHACSIVTHDVIFSFFSDYWLCKISYKEISALYLLYVCSHVMFLLRITMIHQNQEIVKCLYSYQYSFNPSYVGGSSHFFYVGGWGRRSGIRPSLFKGHWVLWTILL